MSLFAAAQGVAVELSRANGGGIALMDGLMWAAADIRPDDDDLLRWRQFPGPDRRGALDAEIRPISTMASERGSRDRTLDEFCALAGPEFVSERPSGRNSGDMLANILSPDRPVGGGRTRSRRRRNLLRVRLCS